jgi:hypothetical protein
MTIVATDDGSIAAAFVDTLVKGLRPLLPRLLIAVARKTNVRFWHLADMVADLGHVRFQVEACCGY